jgi:ATP-dependent RNA helicase RhlB
MKFNELELDPRLLKAIANRGYKIMTDVQEKTLALAVEGRDVTVQSQTGTGKTAVFLITLMERMLQSKRSERKPALIIVPTRELAVQIEGEARFISRGLDFSIGALYGGVGVAQHIAKLRNGLDIIIGTPGRLMDLSDNGHLRLNRLGILVIDEADRMLDMGFLPDIKKLLRRMPPRTARQTLLFSATLTRASKQIIAEHLNRPVMIEITPERLTADAVSQEIYHVKNQGKLSLMLGILKEQTPRNALIFTNMKYVASRLSKRLKCNGYQSRHLTGDLPQNQRLRIINDFMAGKFPYLVATDVAARGLQIDDLDMVINYDLPQDSENYVHRIGRTARAGNTGKAISFACEKTAGNLPAIESLIGMKIPVRVADSRLYASISQQEVRPGRKFQPYNTQKNRSGFRQNKGRPSSRPAA